MAPSLEYTWTWSSGTLPWQTAAALSDRPQNLPDDLETRLQIDHYLRSSTSVSGNGCWWAWQQSCSKTTTHNEQKHTSISSSSSSRRTTFDEAAQLHRHGNDLQYSPGKKLPALQQQELLPRCSSFPLFFICDLSRTEQRLRALLQTSFKQLLSLSLSLLD